VQGLTELIISQSTVGTVLKVLVAATVSALDPVGSLVLVIDPATYMTLWHWALQTAGEPEVYGVISSLNLHR
jgi:hypothetical protein